jgi:hypothetical protein
VPPQLVMAVVVIAFNRRVLDGAVHPLPCRCKPQWSDERVRCGMVI